MQPFASAAFQSQPGSEVIERQREVLGADELSVVAAVRAQEFSEDDGEVIDTVLGLALNNQRASFRSSQRDRPFWPLAGAPAPSAATLFSDSFSVSISMILFCEVPSMSARMWTQS
jgi:hypothetical protein